MTLKSHCFPVISVALCRRQLMYSQNRSGSKLQIGYNFRKRWPST